MESYRPWIRFQNSRISLILNHFAASLRLKMQDNAVTALGAVIRQLSTHIQPTQAAEAISSENQYNNFAVHVVDPKEGVANKKPLVVFYNEQPMRVEDTFWSGKRKLIPDFRRIKTLDKHAVSVRINYFKLLALPV